MATQYFITVGPESSGKSTLVHQLAREHSMPLRDEYARAYLDQLGREYQHHDLCKIGKHQEFLAHQLSGHVVLCDTDVITLLVWEAFAFVGEVSRLQTVLETYDFDHRYYFLMRPDLPWEPDPQREHPHIDDRERIFAATEKLLIRSQANYQIIDGKEQSRYAAANKYLQSVIES